MGEKALLAVMLLAIIAVDILAGKLARRPEDVYKRQLQKNAKSK